MIGGISELRVLGSYGSKNITTVLQVGRLISRPDSKLLANMIHSKHEEPLTSPR